MECLRKNRHFLSSQTHLRSSLWGVETDPMSFLSLHLDTSVMYLVVVQRLETNKYSLVRMCSNVFDFFCCSKSSDGIHCWRQTFTRRSEMGLTPEVIVIVWNMHCLCSAKMSSKSMKIKFYRSSDDLIEAQPMTSEFFLKVIKITTSATAIFVTNSQNQNWLR